MSTMTVHMTDIEEQFIRKYAEIKGITVSQLIKNALYEYIEDQEDAETLIRAIAEDVGTRYSMDDLKKELDL